MKVKVGTFNLNNLFSRFNFKGAIDEIKSQPSTEAMTISYEFTDPSSYRIRTYFGKLIKAKETKKTQKVAQRIITMDVDVLAIQEVENINILKEFNKVHLSGLYPHQILIEGNDPRFIDVGLLSKLPVGAVTSFQAIVHSQNPSERVFSRDLLEVEILNSTRSRTLFTIYNNHLKSHYGDHENGGQGRIKNDTRRQQQAEMIAELVSRRRRSDSKYIIAGDMNDPPDAAPLQPMLTIDANPLFNAITNPQETRPPRPEASGEDPQNPAWTYRYIESGHPKHKLYDQIWLSPALASAFQAAYIDRRRLHGGDGSDHDPVWIELNI